MYLEYYGEQDYIGNGYLVIDETWYYLWLPDDVNNS